MGDQKLIPRFLEACATGEKLSRRVTLFALGHAMREREALREVVKLDVHPAARLKFLEQWTKVAAWQGIREEVGDDDLWFAALRKLLPPYSGAERELFRGQRVNEALGMSWTHSPHIAEQFALYGTAVDREMKYAKPRDGQVMSATLHKEIICAPSLLGHREGEFIVDPRGVHAYSYAVTEECLV